MNQKTECTKYSLQNRNICKQDNENLSLSLSIILSLRNQIFNKKLSKPSEKVWTSLLGEPKKTERTKIFELSKFQIFVNKRFEAPVNHSNMVHFLEAKMLSQIESENEMTGIDV